MDLKIPSAMVERQIFPKHTNRIEMGSGVEAIVAAVDRVLGKDFGTVRGNSYLDIRSTGEIQKPRVALSDLPFTLAFFEARSQPANASHQANLHRIRRPPSTPRILLNSIS
jgi:hypothetical protein